MIVIGSYLFMGMGISIGNLTEAKKSKTKSNIMVVFLLVGMLSIFIGFIIMALLNLGLIKK